MYNKIKGFKEAVLYMIIFFAIPFFILERIFHIRKAVRESGSKKLIIFLISLGIVGAICYVAIAMAGNRFLAELIADPLLTVSIGLLAPFPVDYHS